MKIYKYIFLVLSSFSVQVFSQVNIGEVAEKVYLNGNMVITNDVGRTSNLENLKEYKQVNGENKLTNYKLAVVDPSEINVEGKKIKGQVKEIPANEQVVPIVIQPYHIKNILGDDLNNLDLQIPTSKYIVAISNFQAIDNLNLGFETTNDQRGRFQYEVFQEGGTWRVRIGNPSVDLVNESPLNLNTSDYKFDIIIYSNKFFNNLGEVKFTGVGQNGNAGNTVIVD